MYVYSGLACLNVGFEWDVLVLTFKMMCIRDYDYFHSFSLLLVK